MYSELTLNHTFIWKIIGTCASTRTTRPCSIVWGVPSPPFQVSYTNSDIQSSSTSELLFYIYLDYRILAMVDLTQGRRSLSHQFPKPTSRPSNALWVLTYYFRALDGHPCAVTAFTHGHIEPFTVRGDVYHLVSQRQTKWHSRHSTLWVTTNYIQVKGRFYSTKCLHLPEFRECMDYSTYPRL